MFSRLNRHLRWRYSVTPGLSYAPISLSFAMEFRCRSPLPRMGHASVDTTLRLTNSSFSYRSTSLTWRMARTRCPAASAASRRVKARGTRGARRVLR